MQDYWFLALCTQISWGSSSRKLLHEWLDTKIQESIETINGLYNNKGITAYELSFWISSRSILLDCPGSWCPFSHWRSMFIFGRVWVNFTRITPLRSCYSTRVTARVLQESCTPFFASKNSFSGLLLICRRGNPIFSAVFGVSKQEVIFQRLPKLHEPEGRKS